VDIETARSKATTKFLTKNIERIKYATNVDKNTISLRSEILIIGKYCLKRCKKITSKRIRIK
jgi:hypothetical protein